MKDLDLGEVLVQAGAIDRRQLAGAQACVRRHPDLQIGQALLAMGLVSQKQITQTLSQHLGLPVVDAAHLTPEPEALAQVPQSMAVQGALLPLQRRGHLLTVATSDPLRGSVLEELRRLTGLDVQIVLAEPDPLVQAIQRAYADRTALPGCTDAAAAPTRPVPAVEANTPVAPLLDSFLQQAAAIGASDLHIEPYKDATRVRMRLDGAMVDLMQLPPALHQALVTRVKVLAGMNIAERRLPQDGHFSAQLGANGETHLRVSVMPTLFGEKAVLRLLRNDTAIDHAPQFGMRDAVYRRFLPLLDRSGGILYLTGPTGSGKTTTLYLILEALRRRPVNIMTIEDPVERSLPLINQTQVNPAAGLTFETGLRALLRQDPDIIMVGETRDTETAMISVRAAITGHQVFSTLHTRSAAGAVVRLTDMGVAPYLVAESLSALVAQRLLRKVCPQCGQTVPVTPDEAALLGPDIHTVRRGAGCPYCHGTGYRGRIAIHELMVIDAVLRRMIVQRASDEELTAYARRAQGMRTLQEEGLDLVRQGLTTPEELLAITCNC